MGVIENPKVPQTINIYSKVTLGTRFIFTGKCETKNFSFALVSSKSESEIALLLEFGVESEKKLVTAKSFCKGKWTGEKIHKNPVRANAHFFIQILTLEKSFEVFSDGNYLFSIPHFLPIDSITGIRLMETMELYKIEMEQ